MKHFDFEGFPYIIKIEDMLIFLHVELKTTTNNNEELTTKQLQTAQKHSDVAVTAQNLTDNLGQVGFNVISI
jgi:hypothetical protein